MRSLAKDSNGRVGDSVPCSVSTQPEGSGREEHSVIAGDATEGGSLGRSVSGAESQPAGVGSAGLEECS